MQIKCVGDITRAGASLRVTCLNCNRDGFVNARFLLTRYGYGFPVADLKPRFRCSICRAQNTRLGLATSELAERKLGPMTHFGGVYAKYED